MADPAVAADDRAQPGRPPGASTASFLPGDSAIMVPHTSDGRVMFAIPWHGHTVVGTTDTPIDERGAGAGGAGAGDRVHPRRPLRYICEKKPHARRHAQRLCRDSPAGARGGRRQYRRAFARPHHPHRELRHGHHLRRQMDHLPPYGGRLRGSRRHAGAPAGTALASRITSISTAFTNRPKNSGALWMYGSDAPLVRQLEESDAGLAEPLAEGLPYSAAEVVWAVRHEMARTLEDVGERLGRVMTHLKRVDRDFHKQLLERLSSRSKGRVLVLSGHVPDLAREIAGLVDAPPNLKSLDQVLKWLFAERDELTTWRSFGTNSGAISKASSPKDVRATSTMYSASRNGPRGARTDRESRLFSCIRTCSPMRAPSIRLRATNGARSRAGFVNCVSSRTAGNSTARRGGSPETRRCASDPEIRGLDAIVQGAIDAGGSTARRRSVRSRN